VSANGLACKSLDDLVPSRQRIPDRLSVLPAELPASVVASLATFSGIPASLRHSASIALGSRSVTLDLPSRYGASVSLRYRGATPADEEAIRAAGSVASLARPYAVHVVPTVLVDGVEQARGDLLLPGEPQEVAVAVSSPFSGTEVERHHVFAGGVYALAFPVGIVPDSLLAAREAAYRRTLSAGTAGDDLEAARVDRALWRYFWNLHRDVRRTLGLQWFHSIIGISEGIAGAQVEADLLYGAPIAIRRGKWVIDIPRGGWTPYSIDGNQSLLVAASTAAQWQGSAWEHRIWEQTFGSPAISTVRIFQAARSQGVNLLHLTSSNSGLVSGLPYSQAARTDLLDALHAGQVATVPERPITWGDYAAREAYVLQDPMTGSGAFRLGGTASGGERVGAPVAGGGSQPPICKGCPAPAESTVGLSLGNMYFTEVDLSVPARGIPVALVRRYDSLSPYGGRLGPGWQHSYDVRLVTQPDGSVVFVNDQFVAQRFFRGGDGSYTPEAGYHEALSSLADGWALTFKDGTEYRFRLDPSRRRTTTWSSFATTPPTAWRWCSTPRCAGPFRSRTTQTECSRR
jgi:hypothetical protein